MKCEHFAWSFNSQQIISILFHNIYSKDARLPVQLQRAMAAEAEAAREARAKVRKIKLRIISGTNVI